MSEGELLKRPQLVPLLTPRQKFIQGSLAVIWVVGLVYFWVWWLDPEHNVSWVRYALNTAVMAWVSLLPLYIVSMFFFARVPAGDFELPPGSRVAMVVTKAPSESFSLVRKTLEAMLSQDYPHETWLADEDPQPATLAWCAEHGVRVSTRKGVTEYHRDRWPRKTRCKEGNLAYFYDHYGYDNYEFVVQMDSDHVPTPGYLRQMLRPFADPAVGYVSAPSICDINADESWCVRGRLYAEGLLHGLQQAAYNNGWAPMCIGSHYAVRTKALKEIGGLGPELAEDHSTTLLMNAGGWKGVHAFDAIAHGAGPVNFIDLSKQEFQWCRSIVTIMLDHMPTYFAKLNWWLRFEFLFSQLWYPLCGIFMLATFAIPIAAIVTGQIYADVTFVEFYIKFIAVEVMLVVLCWLWHRSGFYRPISAKFMSWESFLFLFARWPWLLLASLAAVRDHFTKPIINYRVTPKEKGQAMQLPVVFLLPYVCMSAASGGVVILFPDAGDASGFYIFALINCLIYGVLALLIFFNHNAENQINFLSAWRSIATTSAATAALAIILVTGAVQRGEAAIEGLAWGWDQLIEGEPLSSVSGAGRSGYRLRRMSFVAIEKRAALSSPGNSCKIHCNYNLPAMKTDGGANTTMFLE